MSALYDTLGRGYADHRRPDLRIAAQIERALGDAESVVNIGAGTGSYESRTRRVTAVEPSATMIAQRPPGAAKVVQASAERLPFPDKSFDAATAFLTTHHWSDLDAGLREMKRVARKRCVFFDHAMAGLDFWMLDYFPEMRPTLKPLLPLETARAMFGRLRVEPVPVPQDCTDGFFCAYWRRPERYLDPDVRAAISFFSFCGEVEARMAALKRDLEDGSWARRNAAILDRREMDYGYRLVVAELE